MNALEMLNELSAPATAISGIATAIGVFIAGYQLRMAKQQATTAFADILTDRYREIIQSLPISAVLGEEVAEEEVTRHLGFFYRYFDLCNQQAFLATKKRINSATWHEWKEGIAHHMRRPAYRRAWQIINERLRDGDTFERLRVELPDSFPRRPPGIANGPTAPHSEYLISEKTG